MKKRFSLVLVLVLLCSSIVVDVPFTIAEAPEYGAGSELMAGDSSGAMVNALAEAEIEELPEFELGGEGDSLSEDSASAAAAYS